MRLLRLIYAVIMTSSQSLDSTLVDAAAVAIQRWGLTGLTLDRVAETAGISRATLYRRQVRCEDLVSALMDAASHEYSMTLLGAVTRPGTAAQRLRQALNGLCEVAEQRLHLLAGMFVQGSELFHTRGREALVIDVFAQPIERLLRDGVIDGSLRTADPVRTATVIFNMTGWTYVHLRVAHDWPPETARDTVVDLIAAGLIAPTSTA